MEGFPVLEVPVYALVYAVLEDLLAVVACCYVDGLGLFGVLEDGGYVDGTCLEEGEVTRLVFVA